MKSTPFLVLCALAATVLADEPKIETLAPGSAAPKLQLGQFAFKIAASTIWPETPGESGLLIQVANHSAREVFVLHRIPLSDYGLTVIDDKGREVPLRSRPRDEELIEHESPVRGSAIEAGATHSITIDLSRLFALDRPGTYTVRASWPHRPVPIPWYHTILDPSLFTSVLDEPPLSEKEPNDSRDDTRRGAPKLLAAEAKIIVPDKWKPEAVGK